MVLLHGRPAHAHLCSAFFSCFFVWPFTARFGRRLSIVLAAMVFNVGAILQLFSANGVATWYAGRVIAGIGIGFATVIVPLYTAEMAPKQIRGQLGSMFQFFFTLGVMTSYWVDYGVSTDLESSTKQWRIPVGLQLVPGGILCMGMLLVKESTRWLAKRGRADDALDSLIWVRGGDSTAVREEYVLSLIYRVMADWCLSCRMAEILAGIREEERITEGVTWKEFLLPANRFRMFISITIQIGEQTFLKRPTLLTSCRGTTDRQHVSRILYVPSPGEHRSIAMARNYANSSKSHHKYSMPSVPVTMPSFSVAS